MRFKSPARVASTAHRLRLRWLGHNLRRISPDANLAVNHGRGPDPGNPWAGTAVQASLRLGNARYGDMIGSLHLAELLCSRLCHDLSGLLGSLVGVLEIAREEQAVELAQRLRLLRAAWGQDSEPVDLAQLLTFADGLFASRRLRLDLFGMEPDVEFASG